MQELGRKTVDEFRQSEKIPVIAVMENVRSGYNVGSLFRTSDAFLLEALYLVGYTAFPPHKEIRKTVEDGYERAKHVLTENQGQLESLAQALLEYETLSGDEIKKVLAGESIDRGSTKGPSIPAAGSSIPKAKRPKAGSVGGPAVA